MGAASGAASTDATLANGCHIQREITGSQTPVRTTLSNFVLGKLVPSASRCRRAPRSRHASRLVTSVLARSDVRPGGPEASAENAGIPARWISQCRRTSEPLGHRAGPIDQDRDDLKLVISMSRSVLAPPRCSSGVSSEQTFEGGTMSATPEHPEHPEHPDKPPMPPDKPGPPKPPKPPKPRPVG